MEHKGNILLVDDDKGLADSVIVVLESRGYKVFHASDGEDGLTIAKAESIDVVLTDFRMPGMGGMDLLKKLRELRPKLPVILATAFGTTNLAINATKYGAFDYLIKPFEMPDLLEIIERANEANRLASQPVQIGTIANKDHDAIIGESKPMQEVFRDIGRIAQRQVTVMIQGETGTGKELVARALYQHSKRSEQPFVAVNCAAIPENLLESELFGHEKGAFTGAASRRIGRFEQANKGTLFLDEIGDLPSQTQVKLLRVLQERIICRVGSKDEIPIDVRVICATHQDIPSLITENRFREDLYYRLNAAVIVLPPLRVRINDIRQLVEYFVFKCSAEFEVDQPKVEEEAIEVLLKHPWPGNVRELENVVRRTVIDANGFPVTANLVRECLESSILVKSESASDSPPLGFSEHIKSRLELAEDGQLKDVYNHLISDLELDLYKQCMRMTNGNQSKISRWLGVSRITVREKLDKYNLLSKREEPSLSVLGSKMS